MMHSYRPSYNDKNPLEMFYKYKYYFDNILYYSIIPNKSWIIKLISKNRELKLHVNFHAKRESPKFVVSFSYEKFELSRNRN